MGDPAGIGPEIILKAYEQRLPQHVPVVFGDLKVLEGASRTLSASPRIQVVSSLNETCLTGNEGINLFPVTKLPRDSVYPGKVNPTSGNAAGRYIEAAIEAAKRGDIAAVVTCPIHKHAFHKGGYPYPGHTEMFADKTGTRHFGMMMASALLKVSLVTIHLPLKDIPPALTRPRIRECITLTLKTLEGWFGIPRPDLCILGLNPHAGENGDMGSEETEIIAPVVRDFQNQGVHVTGPIPADTAFVRKNLKKYDAFVAMYHDQGLIPFKLLAFENGINVTMGLPFPRVSVDHGTGLDIAGKGIANPGSLRSAIRWAVRFAKSSTPTSSHPL